MLKSMNTAAEKTFDIDSLSRDIWTNVVRFSHDISERQKLREVSKFFKNIIDESSACEIKQELQEQYLVDIKDPTLQGFGKLQSAWLEMKKKVYNISDLSPFIQHRPKSEVKYIKNSSGSLPLQQLNKNLQTACEFIEPKLVAYMKPFLTSPETITAWKQWNNSYQKILSDIEVILVDIPVMDESIQPMQTIKSTLLCLFPVFFKTKTPNDYINKLNKLWGKSLLLKNRIKDLQDFFEQQQKPVPHYLQAFYRGLNNLCVHLEFLCENKNLNDLGLLEKPKTNLLKN